MRVLKVRRWGAFQNFRLRWMLRGCPAAYAQLAAGGVLAVSKFHTTITPAAGCAGSARRLHVAAAPVTSAECLRTMQGAPLANPLTARLHPKWVGGRDGYRYSVICRGELIVDRSRDPECDAARALLAMGYTGKLTLLDGKTGIPRTIIDVEKAARLRVSEESRDGLKFRRMDPADASYSDEDTPPVRMRAKG